MEERPSLEFMRALYPNWPEGYKTAGGVVINGISTAFPQVLWTSNSKDAIHYLIPSSILCGQSLIFLSKSMRDKPVDVSLGSYCTAVVAANEGIDPRDPRFDRTVKALKTFAKDHSMRGQYFYADCVFSELIGATRRCFTQEFGFPMEIEVPPILSGEAGKGVIPLANVLYECLVEMRVVILDDNNEGAQPDPCGMHTQFEAYPVLFRVEKIKEIEEAGKDGRLDETHIGITRIGQTSWNKERLARGEVRLLFVKDPSDEDENSESTPPSPVMPPLPRRWLSDVQMFNFDNNIQVRVMVPKTEVKLTQGMWLMQRTAIRKEKLMQLKKEENYRRIRNNKTRQSKYNVRLRPGQRYYATLVYNEFLNDAYYVDFYDVDEDEFCLESRKLVEDGLDVMEYLVNARESTLFKGFYTADPLRYNLIADPKRILRNVDLNSHRDDGCPVWMRVEKDHHRLAHFTIASLHRESGVYSREEKMMGWPNITGIGFLIDHMTGAIYSQDFPQLDIRLPRKTNHQMPLGHRFYFNAAYWPRRDFYLASCVQMISTERFPPVPTFLHSDNPNVLLFRDTFYCTTIQMKNAHISFNFGPIMDPMCLVHHKAERDKTDIPEQAVGFLCFNPEWTCGKDSRILLFGLEADMDKKMLKEVTSQPMGTPNGEPWWKAYHDAGGCGSSNCRCEDIFNLIYEIRQQGMEALQERPASQIFMEPAILEQVEKLYQQNKKAMFPG